MQLPDTVPHSSPNESTFAELSKRLHCVKTRLEIQTFKSRIAGARFLKRLRFRPKKSDCNSNDRVRALIGEFENDYILVQSGPTCKLFIIFFDLLCPVRIVRRSVPSHAQAT